MNYTSLEKKLNKYNSAIALDQLMSSRWRDRIKNWFIDLTIVLFIWFAVSSTYTPAYTALIQGLTLISLGISILLFCLESFYYDLYLDDLITVFPEPHFKNGDVSGSYLVAEIIKNTRAEDVIFGLSRSISGRLLALRLDIPLVDLDTFAENKKNKININELEIQTEEKSDLFESFITSIYNQDKEFKDFLFQYSVREKDLAGASRWITKQFEREKRLERWWGRDSLSKTDSVGKD